MLKGLSIDLKSLDLTIDKFLCILIPGISMSNLKLC